MPDVRVVDSMQDQVGQADRVDQVFILLTVEGLVLDDARGLSLADPLWKPCLSLDHLMQVLRGLCQKSPSPTARVVHSLADLRVKSADHRPDHLARREKLPCVRSLLPHL